jgi:WD40 repeat protein
LLSFLITFRRCRITSTAVHPSGRAALTIGFDGTLRLWDLTKGKGVHTLDTKLENILQIRWTPDGENFLITTEKYIHMFTSETCKIIHTWIIPDMNDKITSMEIIPITNESGGKKTKSGKKETNNHSWFLIIGCETGQFLISLWTTIQTFSSSDNTVGISSSTIQSHSFISVNSPYPKRIKQIKLYNSSVIIVLQSNGIVTLMDIQKIYEKDIINRTEQEFTTEDKNDLISSLYTLKDAKDTRPITCALSNI